MMRQEHEDAMCKLCYVCGIVIRKNGHNLLKQSAFCSELTELFPCTDLIEKINSKVYPCNTCHPCYLTVKKYLKKKADGKAFLTNKKPLMWMECDIEHCIACCEYNRQTQSGVIKDMNKKKKNQFIGRPQFGDVWDVNQIKKHDLGLKLDNDTLSLLSENNANIKQYQCIYCTNVPSQPVNLRCCEKASCHSCLCQFLMKSKLISHTSCPNCCTPMSYSLISRSPYLEDAIRCLELPCPVTDCGKLVRLDRWADHKASCNPVAEKKKIVVTEIRGLMKDSNKLQIPTGGLPYTFVRTIEPRKELVDCSPSAVKKKRKCLVEHLEMASGSKPESHLKMKAEILRKRDGHHISSSDEREKILEEMGLKSNAIGVKEGMSMMLDLNMTWYKYRNWSRWMRKFRIKYPTEKKMRQYAVDELKCTDIMVEMVPFSFTEEKKNIIKAAPMAYVSDLKDFVFKRLDYLYSAGLLIQYDFMDGDIHIKIGGDHGQKSFKEHYQICNVKNPNSKDNTVVFTIFEAKDRKSNLKIALNQYRKQINELQYCTWQGRGIKVFLSGDYDNLTEMYGLSGASGKFCCLWCYASKDDMKKVSCNAKGRTLGQMDIDLAGFRAAGGNLFMREHAKDHNNQIDDRYFDILLSQVVVPGLHITLGVVLKIFNLFERDVKRLDFRMSHGDDSMVDHVLGQEEYIASLEEGIIACTNRYNWQMANASDDDADRLRQIYEDHVTLVQQQIDVKVKALQEYKEKNNLVESGPIHKRINEFLPTIGVKRQAFHSNSFTGNHCHALLKPDNIKEMVSIPLQYLGENGINDITLTSPAQSIKEEFGTLLTRYSICHNLMNSRDKVDVSMLDSAIIGFMSFWRSHWPDQSIPPKFHMLEKHVLQFIRKWKVGLGFYGEQGGESIHHEFVNLYDMFSNMTRDPRGRLYATLNRHHLKVHPQILSLRPDLVERNLAKRKAN